MRLCSLQVDGSTFVVQPGALQHTAQQYAEGCHSLCWLMTCILRWAVRIGEGKVGGFGWAVFKHPEVYIAQG